MNASAAMMDSSLNVDAWRSRVEKNEGCADKKWQKKLQKPAEIAMNC